MIKKITIANERDRQKFIKKLFLYKSLIYKFTTFKIESKNQDVLEIERALNIKKRKKRIAFIYDESCIKIDNYNKGKNLCGFKNNKCLTQQKPNCPYTNGCCRRCIFQSTNGCTTSNLTCKLFFCTLVTKKHKVLTSTDLPLLKLLSLRQREILKHNYFSSREEVLTDLYIGSLLIFTIRIIFRYLTKNIVFGNQKKLKYKIYN